MTSYYLIYFSLEGDLLSILHPLLNMNFQHLLVLHNLSSLALWAFVFSWITSHVQNIPPWMFHPYQKCDKNINGSKLKRSQELQSRNRARRDTNFNLCSHDKHAASVISCLVQADELKLSCQNLDMQHIDLMHILSCL